EDCLTLNVVRPNIDLRDLPVLVWIYGGGFSGGSTFSPVYNLRYIVQESIELGEPIIAVSIIYRLPTFGFLASAEVVASGNANLGLRDQHLALHWIQENIAYFGGGRSKHSHESAGAYSVGLQALAYGGGKDGETDLFRGAIYESGAALGSCADDVEHTQASYDDIVHQIGCDSSFDTLDCLRATPYDVLYTAYALKFGFGPVVDGAFIPDFPSKLLSTGQLDTNIVGLVGANTVLRPFSLGKVSTRMSSFTRSVLVKQSSRQPWIYLNYPSLGSPYGTGDGGVNFAEHGFQYKRSASFAGDINIIAPRRCQCEVMAQWSQNVYSYRVSPIKGRTSI
ncbi:Carboxylesterase family-domain-containing protein, partial [Mucidula mucida]